MRKIDTNLFKNSKIENVIIFFTGLSLFSVGLLFMGVGLLLLIFRDIPLIFRAIPLWINFVMLCIGFILILRTYLYLFYYPYILEIKDGFLGCRCFLKKWQVKWEDIIEMKKISQIPIIFLLFSISPPWFIVKIRNKSILSRYLLLPYVYDKGCLFFDSGKENFKLEEEVRKRIRFGQV